MWYIVREVYRSPWLYAGCSASDQNDRFHFHKRHYIFSASNDDPKNQPTVGQNMNFDISQQLYNCANWKLRNDLFLAENDFLSRGEIRLETAQREK